LYKAISGLLEGTIIMREPYWKTDSGEFVPFSGLPVSDLVGISAGRISVVRDALDDDEDMDFAMIYAGILLKERGL